MRSAPVVKWRTKPFSQSTSATTNLLKCSLRVAGANLDFNLIFKNVALLFRSLKDFLEDEEDNDDYDIDYEEDYHDDSWYVDYEHYHVDPTRFWVKTGNYDMIV